MAEKAADIMDVSEDEVARVMREHSANVLIHGHTHRPATHQFELDGRTATRHVLGDWYEAGHVLVFDDGRYSLQAVSALLETV